MGSSTRWGLYFRAWQMGTVVVGPTNVGPLQLSRVINIASPTINQGHLALCSGQCGPVQRTQAVAWGSSLKVRISTAVTKFQYSSVHHWHTNIVMYYWRIVHHWWVHFSDQYRAAQGGVLEMRILSAVTKRGSGNANRPRAAHDMWARWSMVVNGRPGPLKRNEG